MRQQSFKILISPGFGAGWSTWLGSSDKDAQVFALTYKPIIDAIERGESLHYAGAYDRSGKPTSPVLLQFEHEYKERFGEPPYLGGANNLKVVVVSGPFRVEEYDGSETLRLRDDADIWIDLREEGV